MQKALSFSFFREEIFHNVQPEPPLAQLKAITCSPIAVALEKRLILTTTFFQGVVQSNKGSPELPLLQTKQSQFLQLSSQFLYNLMGGNFVQMLFFSARRLCVYLVSFGLAHLARYWHSQNNPRLVATPVGIDPVAIPEDQGKSGLLHAK